ncbi:MAG: heavy-metal-associated domain-containing protein [Candidatus Latescibacter sp.]|nr:heavy-metal-associated domain-containing protein [Candidatus Latescibacter sp.]
METKKVHIPAVNCKHCIATITRELNEIDGVESVEGDPASKDVTIRWRAPMTWKLIRLKLVEVGYPPEE